MQLKDITNEDSWARFFDLYAPLILGFAKQCGCKHEMACDVLQQTMVRLMRALPRFIYDPGKGKFRSFLLKIVHNSLREAFNREKRLQIMEPKTNGGDWFEQLQDSRIQEPGEKWDALWNKNLLVQALERVRKRVNPRTYRSFEMYVIEERPVSEIQAALDIKANTVYQHRNRLIGLLQREIAHVKEEMGE